MSPYDHCAGCGHQRNYHSRDIPDTATDEERAALEADSSCGTSPQLPPCPSVCAAFVEPVP